VGHEDQKIHFSKNTYEEVKEADAFSLSICQETTEKANDLLK